MKKILLLCLLLNSMIGFAQSDTIYFVANHYKVGKVMDSNVTDIVYLPDTNKNSKRVFIPKNKVRLIAYGNGKFQIVSVKKATFITSNENFQKGVKDANRYYVHPGGSFGTGITSFFTGGVLGLIPAIACSATTPKFMNLGLPKDALVNDRDYMLGYTARAKKIKQKKVWSAFGAGLIGAVVVLAIKSI